jgi:hypothetical protein
MSDRRLEKLFASARKAYRNEAADALEPIPAGFGGRVVTRWLTDRPASVRDLFERLSWCGAAVSAMVCLAAFLQTRAAKEPGAFDLFVEGPAAIEQVNR